MTVLGAGDATPASVVTPDVLAGKAVVHVINRVLADDIEVEAPPPAGAWARLRRLHVPLQHCVRGVRGVRALP